MALVREGEIREAGAPHSRDTADVARELEVDPAAGLSSRDVADRRAKFGPNVVVREAHRPAWRIAVRQFQSIVIALLAIAAVVSFVTRDHAEAFAIVAVLLINAATGFLIEWKSERALENLRIQERTTARVRRDGTQSMIDAEELVPGDVILVDAGARIPADARLVESFALQVEESALTGESVPVTKSTGAVDAATPLAERTPMLFLGTTASSGRGTAIVTATGEHTELGKIGRLVREVVMEPTPLEERLAKLGRRLVYLVLAIGAAVVVAGVLRGDPIWEMVEVGISLAVAAVPEGLPAVTTMILAVGVLRMAKRHAIVRKLPAVETLGSTTVICTDKTGTLTMNRLTVRDLETPDPLKLFRIAALCSDAVVGESGAVGDPTEVALIEAAAAKGIDVRAMREKFPEIEEEAFNPETRRMITIHDAGDGTRYAALKGAPAVVLEMCDRYHSERRASEPLTADVVELFERRNRELAAAGLRVLAFAEKERATDATGGFTFVGFAALADPPREAAAAAIAEARKAGVRVVMLTGDQVETAHAIAHELRLAGESDPKVVHARELAGKDRDAMCAVARSTDVFARVTPADKLRIVETLRDAGEIVAVTGDGVNDAPALRRADIGVAMGKSGTDVAKQASDLILTDDNLATVVAAIEEGRTIYSNITKFVHLMFSHNLGEVIVVFTAIVIGMPLPLMPLQILWMNVVTDIFPAFALAMEPRSPRALARPRGSGGIVSRSFLLLVGWQGTMLAIIALAAYAWALSTYGPGAHARTVALVSLIAVQLGHTFNCRSTIDSALEGLGRNRYLWGSVAVVIALQVLAVSFDPLQRILGTTGMTRADLAIAILCTLLPIAIVEVQKAFVRSRRRG